MGILHGSTTVRPSIVRESVLPTINQGTTVLGTVYGGTTTSKIASTGTVYGQTQTVVTPTPTIQTVRQVETVVTPTPTLQTIGTTGSIMGVGGGIQDNAVDVTYSTKPDAGLGATATTTTTTTQYGLGATGVGYATTGRIMGVGGGVQDYAADVTYSTKPELQ